MEVTSIESGKAKVWAVKDVFKDLGQSVSANTGEPGLKAGTEKGEGASRFGVAEGTAVFAPDGIAHPGAAFATSMAAAAGRPPGPVGVGIVRAVDEAAGEARALMGPAGHGCRRGPVSPPMGSWA